jgi:hypothetical protein
VYLLGNRRPVYPPELQSICFAVLASGCGFGGGLATFNRPRAGACPAVRPKYATPRSETSERAQREAIRKLRRRLAYFGVQSGSDAGLLAALAACKLEPAKAVNDVAALSALLRHLADRQRE